MSEKKLSGFAALMKKRRQEKEQSQPQEEEPSIKPVIKEISLSCNPHEITIIW